MKKNKNDDAKMKIPLKKCFRLISNIFKTYIYAKLCIKEEIVIPNDIPKIKFDKLLANIFNIFKQNDPTFSENLKPTIKELVLETLETLCNDATNYILEKVKSTKKVPQNIKIFKTKININKSTQKDKTFIKLNKESKQLYTPTQKKFKNKLSLLDKKHILLRENNKYPQIKINRAVGESFGKIIKYTNGKRSYTTQKTALEKMKLSELENWYTYANFHKIQILNGIFNFIGKYNQEIKLIPQNERKERGITEHGNNIIEFTTQINKTFFNFFTEYDDKKDKNGELTQVQIRTKQKILKTFYEIQTLELPVQITKNKTIFIRPIHIKEIETSNKKIFLTIEIDTKILLLKAYTIKKLPFFLAISKDKFTKLNKKWNEKVETIKKTNPNKWKIFKDYRLNQLKDLIIKGYNILQYNCHNKTQEYYTPIIISKDNWNNTILPEKRFDNHLIKNNHYKKTSKRTITTNTKNNLRRLLNEFVFEILEEENCLKNTPNVTSNIYRFRVNPKEFNPTQAQKKSNQ